MDKAYNYRMTVKQLENACAKHRFLLLRYPTGRVVGFNTKIAKMIRTRKNPDPNQKTDFISYHVISFQEYISNKVGFL